MSPKPRWCYTNELVDASFAFKNSITPDNNPNNIAVLTKFKSEGENIAYLDEFGQVACEAY
jgi:hypothetical protein